MGLFRNSPAIDVVVTGRVLQTMILETTIFALLLGSERIQALGLKRLNILWASKVGRFAISVRY